ncbi:conserved hypothetical protein [Nitrospina gracilis 3/211]|uniref:Uncharacterized protein TP-0789 domain-containing protein n=1 Tax=Nitrospina gracilis (strain 3/211) TaxID=1266370 RepID=M1YVQ2_NITG3|nr:MULTISPECIES: outer membrane lipoprotein-sorting protein [Nitrospina]MCF8722723.1 outer membrane lipoprotein-sorting protein [Nitrospina sp. Nb-3]CCQ89671.1 conserved hypothetical protein [Nitrospina gracilis 3/211]
MKTILLTIVFAVAFQPLDLSSESPQETGRAIAFKAEETFDKYNDTTADVAIHIKKKDREIITRMMSMKILATEENTDKVLMQFHHPADVKGMAFLIWTHKDTFDDLWVYIPDLRRVKRISTQTKGSDFMGTEFQTEDLIRTEPEKYTYEYLETKPCGELECYLVNRFPKEKSTIYSRQVMWIDTDHFRFQQIDSYDLSGNHVKTFRFFGYRLYDGKFWRWDRHELTDHRTGEVTVSDFINWRFNNGLRESRFTVNGLQNIR